MALDSRLPWNKNGSREEAKTRGKRLASELAGKIPKRRKAAAAKSKQWRNPR